nr:G patch domain and ankyrin repeat-containing protein 1 homolog [Nomia melanderi]
MLKQSNFYTCNIDMTWKTFVRESDDIPEPLEKREHQLAFEGSEARKTYEEIINQESSSILPIEDHKNNKQKKVSTCKNTAIKMVIPNEKVKKNQNPEEKVSINAILKAIEQRDRKFLLKHITQENVNLTDNFGWTPLMSATYCGHLDIVEFLLNLGASKEAREKSGLTAAQLALKKNYLNIVALLKKKTDTRGNKIPSKIHAINARTNTDVISQTSSELIEPLTNCNETALNIRDNTKRQSEEDTGFYCEICEINFHQTSWKKHETSTLHIFNTKPKLPNAMYGISKQSKGYQMLLNTGWDEQVGLGPLGKGIKYPIKTCLKNDRKGLGQSSEKEYRVTHFKAGDVAAVNDTKTCKQKCLKKKDREKLLNREVRKERVLRIMKFDQQMALKHLQLVEEKAGEILTDRQEIVALDKRRNDDRVGMRALQKEKHKKAWVTIGPLLFKMPSKTAEELLIKDQKECDIEINKLRSDLKIKVNELRDLELNPPVPGLMLKPMSHKEMSAIKQIWGQNS